MNDRFTKTPEPPYYAVIFTNRLGKSAEGYAETGRRMLDLALKQPGCLGAQSTRDSEGFGITVSYWESEEAIAGWKAHAEHLMAQKHGIERWYEHFEVRIARVDRAYSGPQGRKTTP
jgi:heme-degrading monooxygenase HmoA